MMTIGLIALDLDGTLLDSQKNLSERNRRALERCARMGIQIVPTTGRAVDGITQEVRSLPGVMLALFSPPTPNFITTRHFSHIAVSGMFSLVLSPPLAKTNSASGYFSRIN